MKKREYNKVIIPELQSERIKLNQCPVCGKHQDFWNRRKDWRCCSKLCTEIFNNTMIVYNWQQVRQRAFLRDDYTCKVCGFRGDSSQLIGDHIIPIALGGEEFDLDNVQTLCIRCDKVKTRGDLKKIAEVRRNDRNNKKGQKTLIRRKG